MHQIHNEKYLWKRGLTKTTPKFRTSLNWDYILCVGVQVCCVHIQTISLHHYFCQDHDRRIREATQQAFEQLVLKVRRSLAPFLKSLMGHWILSQCDTYTPAASTACQAFQAAFSPAKQPEALGFCKDEILNVSKSRDFSADKGTWTLIQWAKINWIKLLFWYCRYFKIFC